MSSKMLTGERRWTSARRGGMTVLGKVAVPKPLNLPSQKLENHGLDPNVEIVPKGTLSWGNRPSSSGGNARASSQLSPKAADAGTVSPSGTRPSTAGSDRTPHEPATSAWGSNSSRPSSASGALTSSQASLTSLRPASAETRPNSSQLSRFAEHVGSEGPVAWGSSGTADRLGVKSSKGDGFSLSSGDFPTLGAEKDKNIDPQVNSRPSSSSSRLSHAKEDTKPQADFQFGNMNMLRTDGSSRIAEDGLHPSMEKWQGEQQHPQYFNPNAHPQHFDTWHGPPMNPNMNPPGGVWYRGRPGGPTFGPPVGPTGFPIEFPYYPPQMPPPGAGPGPGPGPRGHHPNNEDLYRPQHMPDAYARPAMQFRPGFYPRPPGPNAFEGYYGPPPMGYCNNEREMMPPYMGVPQGPPPVYNSYPAHSHGRDQLVSSHQGHQRVTSNNHSEWDRKEEGKNWEHGKGSVRMIKSRKNEWGAEEDAEEDMYAKRTVIGNDNSALDSGPSSGRGKEKSFEGAGNVKGAVNDSWASKSRGVASDGQNDATYAFNREEEKHSVKVGNNAGSRDVGIDPYQPTVTLGGDKIIQPTAAVSRRAYHGGQVRIDPHGKGKFNRDDTDGWKMKPLINDPPGAITPLINESVSIKVAENSMIDSSGKIEGESLAETCDSSDVQEQRAKMRDLAKQRALQLQKEEEERVREQKAKALAKLEELNRRTQAGDLMDETTNISIQKEPQESCKLGEETTSTNQSAENIIVFGDLPLEIQQTCVMESNISGGQPLPKKEGSQDDASAGKIASQFYDGGVSRNKRTGYKQKQNKNLNEKSVSNVPVEAPKDVTHVVTTSMKDAPSEIQPSAESSVPNTVSEPSTQHKRKNNHGKNKHKPDQAQALSDSNIPKEFVKNIEPKASVSHPDSSVSTVIQPDRVVHAPEAYEEAPSRVSNQWKHQPSRKLPRTQQSNKSHGNETAIWAPVRTHSKPESAIEATQKIPPESVNTTKSDNLAQNSLKSKRAEMERYVPKPVAKELAQQGSIPPVSSLIDSSKSDDDLERGQSVNSAPAFVEIKDGVGVGRHNNKHKKEHGTWRQRGSTDSKGGPSSISEPTKDVQKSAVQYQLVKSETDDSNSINITNTNSTPAMKEMSETARGKRHLPRVHRGSSSANNPHHHENTPSGEINTHVNQTDKTTIAPKENRTTSHWQPKSSLPNPPDNQHPITSVTVTMEVNRAPKKDAYQHKVHRPQETDNVASGSSVGHYHSNRHQDFNREKKSSAPAKGRPSSANQDPIESSNTENQHERNRRGGYQNRHHESRGDWQDNRQHNAPAFRERQRHYEYHPVGPNSKHEELEGGNNVGPEDGINNVGPRYRERNQSQSRRGGNNSYRRQSGGVNVWEQD